MKHILLLLLISLLASCFQAKSLADNDVQNDLDNEILDTLYESDLTDEFVDENVLQDLLSQRLGIDPLGKLLSSQAQKLIEGMLKQLPFGCPLLGIPPLAPYKNKNLTLNIDNKFINAQSTFAPLRIDGLDDMSIDQLSVNFFLRKLVKFDFNFKNITASGKFKISTMSNQTLVPGLKPIKRGAGDLNLSLLDLRFKGSFKYKLPILWGRARIYDFKLLATLDDANSKLKGTLNGLPITNIVNRQIEASIMTAVNANGAFINTIFEKFVLPHLNSQLEGNKLWDVLWWGYKTNDQNLQCSKNEMETF